jgi:hypothetical protein
VSERSVEAFDRIKHSALMGLEIRVDPGLAVERRVTVEAPESLQDMFIVETRGSLLMIESKDASYATRSRLLVTVNTRNLSGLEADGHGRVSIRGVAGKSFDLVNTGMGNLLLSTGGSVGTLTCRLDGHGTVDLEKLDCTTVELRYGGMGTLRASGTTRVASYTLSGHGSVDLLSLRATDVQLDSSGMGTVGLWCSGSCRGNSSGMGGLRVKGSPREFTVRHTGMGSMDVV